MKKGAICIILMFALAGSVFAQWNYVTNMPTARDSFAAGVLGDELIVFGGNTNPDGQNTADGSILDLNDISWKEVNEYPDYVGLIWPAGVEEISGVVLEDKLYVFGAWGDDPDDDFYSKTINFNAVYDPATYTWTELADRPVIAANPAVAVYGDKIIVVGGNFDNGLDGDNNIHYYPNNIDMYDPATDSWTALTSLPVQDLAMSATVINGDMLLVIGGIYMDTFQVNTEIMAYDLINGLWTRNYSQIPAEHARVYNNSSSVLPVSDGIVYLVGGDEVGNNTHWTSDKVSAYDMVADEWFSLPSLPEARSSHATLILDNTLYVLGGYEDEDDENGTKKSVYAYSLTPSADIDTIGEYWYGWFGFNLTWYDFDLEMGEVTLGLTDGQQSVFGPSAYIESLDPLYSYNDPEEGQWLLIDRADMPSDIPVLGNHLLFNNPMGDSSDFDQFFLIRKGLDISEDDLAGDYTLFEHWMWPEGYATIGAQAGAGTLSVNKNNTFDLNIKYSDGESEKINGVPWTYDQDNAIVTVTNPGEDGEPGEVSDVYVGQKGLMFSQEDEGDDFGYSILVKKSSGMKLSDVAGTWYYQDFITEEHGFELTISKGIMIIDAKGNFDLALTDYEYDYGFYTDSFFVSGKISLKSDGTFTVKADGGKLSGAFNPTAEMFVVCHTDEEVGLGVGTRAFNLTETDYSDFGALPIGVEITGYKGPDGIFAETDEKLQFSVELTNQAEETLMAETEVTVYITAVNVDTSDEVALGSEMVSLKNLKPGKAAKAKFTVENTSILPVGNYTFKFSCNGSEDSTQDSLEVAYGYTQFTAEVLKVKVPTAVIAGEAVKGSAQIMLTNTGNMATEKETLSTITIMARDGETEFEIGQTELKIGNTKPGKAKKATVSVDIPADVPQGNYELFATAVTPTIGGAGNSTAEQPLNASVAISEPFVDLVGEIGAIKASSLIIPGTKDAFLKVPVEISNIGNVPLEKGQVITVELYMTNGVDDVFVGELFETSISGLATGKVKKLKVSATIPDDIDSGEYTLYALIDTMGDVDESNEDNNLADYETSLAVTGGFMEMTGFELNDSKTYRSTAKGNLFGDTATEAYTIEVSTNNGMITETIDEYPSGNYLAEQFYLFEEWDGSVFLDEFAQELDMGSITFVFDDLDILAKKDTSEVYGYFDTSGLSIDMEGTASSKGKTSKGKVEVNGETVEAIVYSFSFKLKSEGVYEYEDPYTFEWETITIKIDLSQSNTYFVVPGLGVVEAQTSASAKVSVPGAGSESGKMKEVRTLLTQAAN